MTFPDGSRPRDGRLKMVGRGRLSGSVTVPVVKGTPVNALVMGVTVPTVSSWQLELAEAGSKKGVDPGVQLAIAGLVTCIRQILPSVSLKKTRSTLEPSLGRYNVGRAATLFFAGSSGSSAT